MRLYSYIKTYGNYTKKEVYELLNNNQITVNGLIKNSSYIIRPNDIVKVNDQIIKVIPYKYFIYHKPINTICTNDLNHPNSIFNHLNLDSKYFTVGRLDKDTEGLIIITNDGKFSYDILNSDNHIEKEYEVYLRDPITSDFLNKIEQSFNLSGKDTIPAKIISYSDKIINLVIYEGMHHQIKRIVSLSNNRVVKLKRVRIGNLTLNNLPLDTLKEIPNIKEII